MEYGIILGHEDVGITEDVGDGVANFKVEYKVNISCVTSNSSCY